MPRVILPEMTRVPEGASREVRDRMYEEYKAELMALNPGHFNSDGSLKGPWQMFKDLFRRSE
jgi:hypothetical protein